MDAACLEWNSCENSKIWKANHNTLKSKILEWGYESVEAFCGIKPHIHKEWHILYQHKDIILGLVSKYGPQKATELFNIQQNTKVSKRLMSKFAKENGWAGGAKDIRRVKMSDDEILIGIQEHKSIRNFVAISGIGRTTCYRTLKRAGYASINELLSQPVNHKVVSVIELSKLEDTFCLEVEDTHCFFVEPGVLIHNSDGTGPDVEILAGAENLDQIADIEYFKKKMIAPTKIPFKRVGIGQGAKDDGNEKSLSSSDAEFAKAVQWVQREVATGLMKVAICHLAMAGYSVDDIKNFTIGMSASSAIDELYRMETWQGRTSVMADLKDLGWFPREWIVTRFTDLSPDEIQEMSELLEKDQEMMGMDELGKGGGGGGGLPLGGPKMPGGPELPEIEGEPKAGAEPVGLDELGIEGEPGELGAGAVAGEAGLEYIDKREQRIINEDMIQNKRSEHHDAHKKFIEKIRSISEGKAISPFSHLMLNNEFAGLDSNKKIIINNTINEDEVKEVVKEYYKLITE